MSYVIQHSGIKGMKWGESKYIRKYKYGTDDPEGGIKSGETKTGNVGGWVYVYKGNPDTGSKNEESDEETDGESVLDKLSKLKDSLFEKASDLKDTASDKIDDLIESITENKYDSKVSEMVDSVKKQFTSEDLGSIVSKTKDIFEDVKSFVNRYVGSDKDVDNSNSKQEVKPVADIAYNRNSARNAIRDDRDAIYEKTGEKEDLINNKNYEINMKHQFGEKKPLNIQNGEYAKYLKDTNAVDVINGSYKDKWRTSNCALCVVASDLTLKGYSVEALQSNGGLYESNYQSIYKTNGRNFTEYSFYNDDTVDKMLSDLSKNPSSYGVFNLAWSIDDEQSHKVQGYHSILYSVNSRGEVSLYDPQSGEYMPQSDLTKMPISSNIKTSFGTRNSSNLRVMEVNDDDSRFGSGNYVMIAARTMRLDDLEVNVTEASKICRSADNRSTDNLKVAKGYTDNQGSKKIVNDKDTYWTTGNRLNAGTRQFYSEQELKKRYSK